MTAPPPAYNRLAVDNVIRASRKPIGKREGSMIHALLRGNERPRETGR